MKEQQLKIDLLVIEDALETHSKNCGLDYSETYGKNFSRLKSLLENRNMNKNIYDELAKKYDMQKELLELLKQIHDIINRDDDSYISSMLEESKAMLRLKRTIKEIEKWAKK